MTVPRGRVIEFLGEPVAAGIVATWSRPEQSQHQGKRETLIEFQRQLANLSIDDFPKEDRPAGWLSS
jgi:hypothetical protein